MKKTGVLLVVLSLLVFAHLAYAVTVMPDLRGTWTGKTTQADIASPPVIDVTLTVTAALPASATNKNFSGTLTIGVNTINVIVNNTREFYKVEVVPTDQGVALGFGGALAWVPGPKIIVHGLGFNGHPYKGFILNKQGP
jgi:hypothetical protein